MDRLMMNANMSDCTTVAENCQGASVMSVNNTVNCRFAFEGTPDGVSFFAFTRFIGYAFYYYSVFKNCSSALFKGVKESYAAA